MPIAGTDDILIITPIQPLAIPCPMTLLFSAVALGTAGTTATTVTVNRNGVATSLTFTVAAGATTAASGSATISCNPGDVLTLNAVLGTGALNPSATLWLERATP